MTMLTILTYCVRAVYMPPEVMGPVGRGKYDPKAWDIFSLGMVRA
jgi:hypothetical protein